MALPRLHSRSCRSARTGPRRARREREGSRVRLSKKYAGQTFTRTLTEGRRWLTRRLLSTVIRRRSGLPDMTKFPARLTMPLRRNDLDPVPLVGYSDAGDAVSNIGRILGMTVWLVTDYDQARAVLNDPSYSADVRSLLGTDGDGMIGGLGFTDPPDHTRLRKVLMPEFTGRRLATLLPALERIVEDQLDALEAAGPIVDIVADFAFPVPFAMICELLGLQAQDREKFRRLGHDRFDVNGGGGGIFGAMSESREFMREAVSAQRENPGDGLIGGILRKHGNDLDDEAIAGLADGVFTGGYETSASMLALGVLALIRDPQSLQRMREDESAVDGIVDELLRYLSVVQVAFPRFARRDVELSSKQVRAGDVVVCSLSRANRSDVFGDAPDRFDPARPGRSHVAFGHGFHRCIGSELARMQLRVAFRALARRFPTMSLAVQSHELEFYDLSIVYGVRALPVRLHEEPQRQSLSSSAR